MAQLTSAIRYSLRENKLPVDNAPAYTAQVHGYKTINQEMLVDIMARKNTLVSRHDIIVVLDLLETVVQEELLAGNRIKTNLFNARISIRGGFASVDQEFDKSSHTISACMNAGSSIRKYIAFAAHAERVTELTRTPKLKSVYDFASEQTNRTVTPGQVAEIKGSNLLWGDDNPQAGVYLANEETGEETKAAFVQRKTATSVFFTVPEGLMPGSYKVIIRVFHNADKHDGGLKDIVTIA